MGTMVSVARVGLKWSTAVPVRRKKTFFVQRLESLFSMCLGSISSTFVMTLVDACLSRQTPLWASLIYFSKATTMYGKTVMFLGATDVTHTNNWQWMSSQTPLVGAKDKTKWAGALPSVKDNKDCLAQDSTTGKWINVDCEDDNLEALIANLCVKQA